MSVCVCTESVVEMAVRQYLNLNNAELLTRSLFHLLTYFLTVVLLACLILVIV